MRYNVILLILISATLWSCVPKDQYNAALTELNYYRNQSERADSLEAANAISTYNSSGNESMELQRRIQQVESLTATNISLNQSFQDIKARYDEQLRQNKLLLEQNGAEVTNLQQNLADRAKQVSEQEQTLRQKELELQAREAQLSQLGGGTAAPSPYGSVATPAAYDQQAPQLNEAQNFALQQNQLQNQLAQSLVGFPRNEAVVTTQGAQQVIVTVSQSQLFADGYILSQNGRVMLQRLAQVLQSYPAASLQIVGHSDASQEATAAFENGTDRAIAVTQNLISHGINPQSILAGSKGYYVPVANNTTATERAANRRTEIIISLR
ncbi:MAG: OmpA family protein [Bacteroidota bacterium]